MMLIEFSSAFIIYTAFIACIKIFLAKKPKISLNIEKVKYVLLLLTPDFIITYVIKKYKYSASHKEEERKNFIENANHVNLVTSLIGAILIFAFHDNIKDSSFRLFLLALFAIRYISRCIEIIISFTTDALSDEKNSALNKNDRIKLSITSYIEIYIISACFYLLSDPCLTEIEAIIASLSVGTLTNVSYVLNHEPQWISLMVFFQVFSVITLIILSIPSAIENSVFIF
jgi:hypothetical protein